jgi:hypothetical protein
VYAIIYPSGFGIATRNTPGMKEYQILSTRAGEHRGARTKNTSKIAGITCWIPAEFISERLRTRPVLKRFLRWKYLDETIEEADEFSSNGNEPKQINSDREAALLNSGQEVREIAMS